jgi:D-xylose 1-dehydrogenase (NADP+, D-xylono-1,5-lactone-forming)
MEDMMSGEKVRWGILSTANIGRRAVIPAIKASKNGQAAAVASRDADRASAFAAELDIPKKYSSYEALLADPAIDAVYIPLPNSLHCEWAIKAAQAGKHILCEKPLAMNASQCAEMEAAAISNGVLLMEAFMYRFHPRSQQIFEWVKAGKIGPLRMIQAGFTFLLTRPNNIRLNYELGGGALMDVGCYCVNVCRTLAGRQPEAVQASAHWAASGVDDRLVGTLQFSDGLIAQFDCALTMERRETYTAAGPDGYFMVPGAFLPGTEDSDVYEMRGREELRHQFAGVDQYGLMVEHFANCVINRHPVLYPPKEAAANMAVIEALYRSAHNQGKWQEVLQ